MHTLTHTHVFMDNMYTVSGSLGWIWLCFKTNGLQLPAVPAYLFQIPRQIASRVR